MKQRMTLMALCLCLLCACVPQAPAPSPTPAPTHLTWLHGFYASSSYRQIDLAQDMDGVSLGWGRMFVDDSGAPYVNQTSAGGNLWVVPQGSELATGYFQERSIPYHLCVFATTAHKYGDTSVLEYLLDPEVRQTAADALVAAAEPYSGLTIDFEGLYDAARRDDFSQFVALVREKLPPEQSLYIAVPPDTWYQGYDYRALGAVCDKVILMAHDYQWQSVPAGAVGTEDTYTPLSPLPRVEEALWSITDPDTGVADVSKVALALSFATVAVEVEEEGDILKGDKLYNPGVQTLAKRLAQEDAEICWDELSASSYVFYHDEAGRRYKVWYESPESVAAKIDAALQCGVTGLSLWRLGAVPNFEHYDVWSVILDKARR